MIFGTSESKRRNYIYWLCDLVNIRRSQYDIMETLMDIEYEPEYGNDVNRAIDGLALRHRYEHMKSFMIVDDSPCSQLEMMVALAERAVELMADDEKERDAGFYFGIMLQNLGVRRARSKAGIEKCVAENELFVTQNPPEGWETMEIWKKMNWWLTELWYEDGDDEW